MRDEKRSSANGSVNRRVLLIGPGELPDDTHRALSAAAARVTRLVHPSDAEIREELTEQVDSVIVCSRDDAVALRLALVVEHVRPGVPLIVTVHSQIVTSNQAVDRGPGWFKVFSAVSMLTAVAFTALFTAGVVERLLDRRLTTVVGPRMVPRKGHVVVVGLGQVGLRLCRLLRELGMPVLAIESDPDRYNVARAKTTGFPWSSVRPAATSSSSGFRSTVREHWPR